MSKWIIIALLALSAMGCAKNRQIAYPEASPCRLIKAQMDAVYPSQIRTRQTPTQEAKLLREYEHYRCGDNE